MKVYYDSMVISMLAAFLCMGNVLTADDITPDFLNHLLDTNQVDEFNKYALKNKKHLELPELPENDNSSIAPDPKLPETTVGGDGNFYCNFEEVHDFPSLWRNHKVPYYIRTVGYSEELVEALKEGISTWNEQVPEIQFVEWKENDTDFVFIMKGPLCGTFAGRQGGPQGLILDSDCITLPIIHHEMMHAIGFSHEHNRRDRDKYLKVLFWNILGIYEYQYERNNGRTPNLLGPYEYLSSMHYGVYSPSWGPKRHPDRVFILYQDGVDEEAMGKSDLTDIDKLKVKRLYGRN